MLDDEALAIVNALAHAVEPRHRPAYFEECARELEKRGDVGPGAAFRIARAAQRRFRNPDIAVGRGRPRWNG
jgi:hypothetical protein